MNSLFVIAPYKYAGMWVFDDERVGLVREPFVSGADRMIDKAVAGIPGADGGFRLVFSDRPFPGYAYRLERTRSEMSGTWYRSAELELEGWLCPALFKYFPEAPAELYVKPEPRPA